MLRTATLAATAFGLLAGNALAADLPQPISPIQPVSYGESADTESFDWTGAYLGANIGWGFLGLNGKDGVGGALDRDSNGLSLGGHAGYNFQVSPSFVFGVEGDFNYNNVDRKFGFSRLSSDWDASARARAGIAFDRTLFYGTGGAAFKDLNAVDGNRKAKKIAVGYTVGGGLEHAFTDSISTRIEYRYNDFGSQKFDLGSEKKTNVTENTVRAGVSYRF